MHLPRIRGTQIGLRDPKLVDQIVSDMSREPICFLVKLGRCLMAKIKMKCHGFAAGSGWAPPFELRDDEAITLVMPDGSYAHSPALIDALVGKTAGGVELFGNASWAAPAASPRGLQRWLHGYSATSWLLTRERNYGYPSWWRSCGDCKSIEMTFVAWREIRDCFSGSKRLGRERRRY